MSRKPVPYTESEKLLAQLMFAKAKAAGTLKPRAGIAALATGSGIRRSISRATSPLDYARDARQLLSQHAPGNRRPQWTRQDLERLLADRDERGPEGAS